MRAVYAAFFLQPARCLRLARQPEARVCPRAVLTYVTLRIRAQFKFIAGCAAEGATSFEFETAQFITATKRSAVVEAFTATAKSSAVVEAFVVQHARVPWWWKCCLQRPALVHVSNCMLLSVSLS